jgi:hypothetical protein
MLLKQGKSSGNSKKIGFLPCHIAPMKLAFGSIIFLEFPYAATQLGLLKQPMLEAY